MSWLSNNAGLKHPGNMTKTDMIKKIKSFSTNKEASSWWISYGLGKVSKKAFNEARGL